MWEHSVLFVLTSNFVTLNSYFFAICDYECKASGLLNPLKKGSTVALVTPMKPNGDVDLQSLRGLLRYHVISGTDGLCILGTTGEATTLSMKEREEVL